jgi:hypothetical protein
MTEKRTPSYQLLTLKKAFDTEGKLNMTYSAKQGQIQLDFSNKDVVDAIQALSAINFYKSMPPIKPGFTAWQDVYKSCYKDIDLYIKFQVSTRGELILSFKEK